MGGDDSEGVHNSPGAIHLMMLAAIDFETQGIDALKDLPTEVGIHLFDTSIPTFAKDYSKLIWETDYPLQTPEVIEVTGITDEMLFKDGITRRQVATELENLDFDYGIDAFIAYNADFDRAVFKKIMEPHPDAHHLLEIPWICAMKDIEHPPKMRCRKLSHLALDYGVAIDPKNLHRALDDVKLMVEMLSIISPDWGRLLARSQEPDITVKAIIPKPFGPTGDGGKGKDAARAAGFNWNGQIWAKNIKENEREETEKKLGYKIAEVRP